MWIHGQDMAKLIGFTIVENGGGKTTQSKENSNGIGKLPKDGVHSSHMHRCLLHAQIAGS